ncbi:ATP-binding cassette domain-containing protein [Yoonia sp.]|uniref:thiamine ABC transporter ATP-binding protein n=1 Tax=Yoonia sp. TaxID=2212373 RepID=UPI001A063CFA|nr:ATP-binding cassette domain-containing protein [Yoonia sp.]MBE0412784.1 ATP-binding cassette domain-containing protein [Yoonia sp.]
MLTCEKLLLQQDDFALRADLALAKGRMTALIGPSGAGKSTLLAAIAGFFPPAKGRIMWNGRDLTDLPPGDRPSSILFQDNNLFPHLSVAQNVGLALRPRLRLSAQDAARVNAALVDVGLAGLGGRKPGALSGGQQSRAALARVLLADKPVVLLDEPFSALGPGLKMEMLDLVRGKLAGPDRLVIMVTHDPADARHVADDVVLVADGRAAAPVETSALFANPPAVLIDYLGQGPA